VVNDHRVRTDMLGWAGLGGESESSTKCWAPIFATCCATKSEEVHLVADAQKGDHLEKRPDPQAALSGARPRVSRLEPRDAVVNINRPKRAQAKKPALESSEQGVRRYTREIPEPSTALQVAAQDYRLRRASASPTRSNHHHHQQQQHHLGRHSSSPSRESPITLQAAIEDYRLRRTSASPTRSHQHHQHHHHRGRRSGSPSRDSSITLIKEKEEHGSASPRNIRHLSPAGRTCSELQDTGQTALRRSRSDSYNCTFVFIDSFA